MFKKVTNYTFESKEDVTAKELKYLKYTKDNYLIKSNNNTYYGEGLTYSQIQNLLKGLGETQYSISLVEGLKSEDLEEDIKEIPAGVTPEEAYQKNDNIKVHLEKEEKEEPVEFTLTGEPTPVKTEQFYLLSHKTHNLKRNHKGWSTEKKIPTVTHPYLMSYIKITNEKGEVSYSEFFLDSKYEPSNKNKEGNDNGKEEI